MMMMDKTETLRVVRGEVFGDRASLARSADWLSIHYSSYSASYIGFRLVEEVEDPKTTLSASRPYHTVLGGSRTLDPEYSRNRGVSEADRLNGVASGYHGPNLGIRLVEAINE
jgi:hypothetical protein